MFHKTVILLGLLAGLAACTQGQGLSKPIISTSNGPDEFTTVPSRPIELPPSFSSLPTPTPGGSNLSDTDPRRDAVVALGGRVSNPAGIPQSDAAIVSQTARFGVDPSIRASLAEADARFRKRRTRGGLLGLGRGKDYFRAYSSQALDAYAELDRFRRAGVQTPTAPPR